MDLQHAAKICKVSNLDHKGGRTSQEVQIFMSQVRWENYHLLRWTFVGLVPSHCRCERSWNYICQGFHVRLTPWPTSYQCNDPSTIFCCQRHGLDLILQGLELTSPDLVRHGAHALRSFSQELVHCRNFSTQSIHHDEKLNDVLVMRCKRAKVLQVNMKNEHAVHQANTHVHSCSAFVIFKKKHTQQATPNPMHMWRWT